MQKVKWGEYRIEDVLQWQSQKEIDPLKLEELKDKTEMIYPFYGQATINNGIISYHQLTNKVLNNKNGKPTILIHSNNQNIVYLETPFYLKDGHGATSVLQSEKLNQINQMFIIASIDKVIKSKYSYNNKATKIELKNTVINLPTKNGMVDFEFMESFVAELEAERIAELEAERIAELEAYLSATGLKDYILTAEEKQVLQDFVNGKFTWDEYKIEDVLQWQSQKEIDPLKLEELKDETEMVYPFYGQSTINNGIISYHQLTNKVLNNKDGKPTILIHSNNQNIVYLETPFYLKDGHGATSVLQGEKLSKVNQMVIVASIDKVIKNKFSYNNKATKIELKSTVINLPTQNNQPNYAIMETFISAIQKLVIKEVVLYADRKIAATKTVVNK